MSCIFILDKLFFIDKLGGYMKKFLVTTCLGLGVSMLFTGCLSPRTQSLAKSLMPSPLMHRADGNDSESRLSVAASGYYGHTGDPADNVKDVNIGGGNISSTFRFGGFFSPLFVNAAFGAFGGSSSFSCSESSCDSDKKEFEAYKDWLRTPEGRDDYQTWALQERLLVGLDFNLGPYLILGAAGGLQLYQEGGEYYRMRRDLDNPENRIAENADDKTGCTLLLPVWVGTHLGRHGEYGTLVAEYDLMASTGYSVDMRFTYTHPTGFFAGYQISRIVRHSVYFGKEFVF